MSWQEIAPADLNRQIHDGEDWTLIDVREPVELDMAKVEGAVHIRMAEIPARLADIPTQGKVAVMCHSGIRSAQVCEFLTSRGFGGTYNVAGGIDRWSTDVDPSIARY